MAFGHCITQGCSYFEAFRDIRVKGQTTVVTLHIVVDKQTFLVDCIERKGVIG